MGKNTKHCIYKKLPTLLMFNWESNGYYDVKFKGVLQVLCTFAECQIYICYYFQTVMGMLYSDV